MQLHHKLSIVGSASMSMVSVRTRLPSPALPEHAKSIRGGRKGVSFLIVGNLRETARVDDLPERDRILPSP
ncbi:MAG TPA: hypothetical protein VGC13_32460 [Longimicrobium sp.]